MKYEKIFGGIGLLFVMGVLAFAVMSGRFGGNSGGGEGGGFASASADSGMTVCGCFDKGFSLSQRHTVLDDEYSTYFVLCRETAGERGSAAFTAGWNSYRSSKPWEASCEAWERSGA